MANLTGAAVTPFGILGPWGTVPLMAEAARAALDEAGVGLDEVDGLVCGYSTTYPHLMLSTVVAEDLGIQPTYAHSMQLGGATGLAMVANAALAVDAGAARVVLVVAGEDRASGQSRDRSVQTLAQVGHPRYEVPLGPTVPAYYGLVASRYLAETGATEADLAELAVLMRGHAATHPGAHFRTPVTVDEVLASRPVAVPLKLLDCCPVSDGAAAVVVTAAARPTGGTGGTVAIRGTAQAHTHQHVTAAPDDIAVGAARSSARALERAGMVLGDVRWAGVYDSFTVTLALLLEAIGLAPPGRAGAEAAAGRFSPGGDLALNTHGGLLSYGHCGVAGGMAHLVEAHRQLTGSAGERQCPGEPAVALLHGEGGVLSSHVSLVLEAT